MNDLDALTHQLEYLFIKAIVHGLRNKSVSIAETKQYANEFLELEPFSSAEDARKKVDDFFEAHQEFTEMKSYIDLYDKEQGVNDKIGKMRNLIKEQRIDEALNIAQE